MPRLSDQPVSNYPQGSAKCRSKPEAKKQQKLKAFLFFLIILFKFYKKLFCFCSFIENKLTSFKDN